MLEGLARPSMSPFVTRPLAPTHSFSPSRLTKGNCPTPNSCAASA